MCVCGGVEGGGGKIKQVFGIEENCCVKRQLVFI